MAQTITFAVLYGATSEEGFQGAFGLLDAKWIPRCPLARGQKQLGSHSHSLWPSKSFQGLVDYDGRIVLLRLTKVVARACKLWLRLKTEGRWPRYHFQMRSDVTVSLNVLRFLKKQNCSNVISENKCFALRHFASFTAYIASSDESHRSSLPFAPSHNNLVRWVRQVRWRTGPRSSGARCARVRIWASSQFNILPSAPRWVFPRHFTPDWRLPNSDVHQHVEGWTG